MAKAPKPKQNGWAIRDDGLLFPAYPKILMQSNYRPYHGDPKAPLEDRLAYLRGELKKGNYQVDLTPGQFDIGTATRGQLLDFAERNYAKILDASKDIDVLRKEVAELAASAGDMAPDPDGPEAEMPKTARMQRLSKKGDDYPMPGDDDAAVRRAKALAAAKGVGAGTIPKL